MSITMDNSSPHFGKITFSSAINQEGKSMFSPTAAHPHIKPGKTIPQKKSGNL